MTANKPDKKPLAKRNPKDWCPRCQERETSPDPKLSLLNSKHEKFCRNLAIGKMTAGEAYMAAGFKTKNKTMAAHHSRLLKKRIEVSSRIEALLSMTIELDVKTREWVDAQLKEIVDRCMQAKPHKDKNGRLDGQWYFDPGNANKALFAMGKDRGMFVEKIEIAGVDALLHGKSDAEVREMVEGNFSDLGRPVCIQIMEKVFGLKYGGSEGSQGADGGNATSGKPVSTLH